MLQHLTVAQYSPLQTGKTEQGQAIEREATPMRLPNLILSIEEPELYLHPNRQRHLSRILLELASGGVPGVAENTQVIYSTHSPLFVDIQRFDQVRRFHKVLTQDDIPKETKIKFATLDEIARIIEQADQQPEGTYTAETLQPRLQALMTPWMGEGFFAELVVLVEGEEDRAVIIGTARMFQTVKGQYIDMETMGISIIPCMGKNNLDRPTSIFRSLGIPTYTIWDSDCQKGTASKQSKSKESNHRLLRLCGASVEDWPENSSSCFACFKVDMGTTCVVRLEKIDLIDYYSHRWKDSLMTRLIV